MLEVLQAILRQALAELELTTTQSTLELEVVGAEADKVVVDIATVERVLRLREMEALARQVETYPVVEREVPEARQQETLEVAEVREYLEHRVRQAL